MESAAGAALITSYACSGLLMNNVDTVILQSRTMASPSRRQRRSKQDLSSWSSFLFTTNLPRFGRRAQIGVMLAQARGISLRQRLRCS